MMNQELSEEDWDALQDLCREIEEGFFGDSRDLVMNKIKMKMQCSSKCLDEDGGVFRRG